MKFMDKIGEMVSESLSNAGPEIKQEMSRLGVQGAAELGSALFTGNSYVPYGQGQTRDDMEGLHEQPQQEQGGREM